MATIRIEQNKGEMYPRVLIAETGERIKGVLNVTYSSGPEPFGTLTLELVSLDHEVDITLDVDVVTPDKARSGGGVA